LGSRSKKSDGKIVEQRSLEHSPKKWNAARAETMMDKSYIEIVRLLLDSAPAIFESPHFAMKGGTAINLFIEDMPRLSVDFEVV
jgi:Nucleotidyl transferase AbiEii toxin, Type IV TA system